jgi:hypothetical protein
MRGKANDRFLLLTKFHEMPRYANSFSKEMKASRIQWNTGNLSGNFVDK